MSVANMLDQHKTELMGWAQWNWSLNTWGMHAIDGGKHKLLALWHPPPHPHPQSFHPLFVRCRVYPQFTWVFSPVCSSSALLGSQPNADSHPSFNVSSWWWQEWPSLQKSWPGWQLTPFHGLVGAQNEFASGTRQVFLLKRASCSC